MTYWWCSDSFSFTLVVLFAFFRFISDGKKNIWDGEVSFKEFQSPNQIWQWLHEKCLWEKELIFWGNFWRNTLWLFLRTWKTCTELENNLNFILKPNKGWCGSRTDLQKPRETSWKAGNWKAFKWELPSIRLHNFRFCCNWMEKLYCWQEETQRNRRQNMKGKWINPISVVSPLS